VILPGIRRAGLLAPRRAAQVPVPVPVPEQ